MEGPWWSLGFLGREVSLQCNMTHLLDRHSFWIYRTHEISDQRYLEKSQMLTLFEDNTFELRWIDYAQTSVLYTPSSSEPHFENKNVNKCMAGKVQALTRDKLQFVPSHYFENILDKTRETDLTPFLGQVLGENELRVDSPLFNEEPYTRLVRQQPS